MVKLSFATEGDLLDFRQWVLEKRDHFDRLLKNIDAQLRQEKLSLSPTSSNGKALDDKVVLLVKESGKWLGNEDIRKLAKRRLQVELTRNEVLKIMKIRENVDVRRKGKGRYTVWHGIVSQDAT